MADATKVKVKARQFIVTDKTKYSKVKRAILVRFPPGLLMVNFQQLVDADLGRLVLLLDQLDLLQLLLVQRLQPELQLVH